MAASFVVYVDESGDEGFRFLANECGSSRWFVLSAIIFRKSNSIAPVAILRDIRSALRKEPKKSLHFRELRHEQRVAFVHRIAQEQARIVSVFVCKPLIGDPDGYQATSGLLYRYVTRLLMERVSWLCRDNRKTGEGDGTAEVIFSNRSAMSYDDLRDYLGLLKGAGELGDVSIDWNVIDPAIVRAVSHEKLAGLQVADAVASSFFFACNRNPLGFVEPRYAQMLASLLYRRRQVLMGYGLKFWPKHADCKKEMPHIAAFEKM